MATAEKLLTAEEFASLPEPAEGGKMELVNGRAMTMPPATEEHGERALDIGTALRAFVRAHALGKVGTETGFILRHDPDNVRAPDVYFVEQSFVARVNWRQGFLDGAPALAVEIISPHDRTSEVQEKVDDYLAAGAQRVWVVEPKTESVAVHRPGGDSHTYHSGDRLTSDDAGFGVEGFELRLDELFR